MNPIAQMIEGWRVAETTWGENWTRWPNRPVRFISDLRVFLTDEQVKQVLQAIDETCHHCWDDEAGCQCWNDE